LPPALAEKSGEKARMSALIEAVLPRRLVEYARVPIACRVTSILVVDEIDNGGFCLRERAIEVPYTKDYDGYADGGPFNWPNRFDISKWGLWIASDRGLVVGGAAVAWSDLGVGMLEGRSDLALLWDIRVRSANRRQGIATALFRAAVGWAESKGCRMLNIETQNVNVPACRFYEKMGCILTHIDRSAYRGRAEIADEIMLIWQLDLSR
jgi:GNAT superfamily N-acetyltransferase